MAGNKYHAKVTRVRSGFEATSPLIMWEEWYKSFFTDFTTFNKQRVVSHHPKTYIHIDFCIKILFYSVNANWCCSRTASLASEHKGHRNSRTCCCVVLPRRSDPSADPSEAEPNPAANGLLTVYVCACICGLVHFHLKNLWSSLRFDVGHFFLGIDKVQIQILTIFTFHTCTSGSAVIRVLGWTTQN